MKNGGAGGIRTLDTRKRIHAFQACALSHSATAPSKRPPHSIAIVGKVQGVTKPPLSVGLIR